MAGRDFVVTNFTRLLIALAGAGACASPGLALQIADEDSDGTETTPATEIVCREQAAHPGSRIRPRRICKTQAQWDALADATRGALRDASNSVNFVNGGAASCVNSPARDGTC